MIEEDIETFRYHYFGKPIPEGWVKVHDFNGDHWSQYCHHGYYGVLIKKVKEQPHELEEN